MPRRQIRTSRAGTVPGQRWDNAGLQALTVFKQNCYGCVHDKVHLYGHCPSNPQSHVGAIVGAIVGATNPALTITMTDEDCNCLENNS